MRPVWSPGPAAAQRRWMTDPNIRLRVVPAIGEVSAEAWDACANPKPAADASSGPADVAPQSFGSEFSGFLL